MPLITIEQAVEVVRRTWAERAETVGDRPTLDELLAAMNAIQPAEPTEEEVERAARAVWSLFSKGTPTNEDIARSAIAAMRGGR